MTLTDTEPLPRQTVLLIDDDPAVQHALVRLFRNCEFATVTAANGLDALELLQSYPVDCVVCDESMPGMPGSEVLRRIRDRWPDIVRLLLTAHADFELAMKAINEGEAYRFITKPWNDSELLVAVQQALEKASLVREVRRLKEQLRRQADALSALEKQFPGISNRQIDDYGYYIPSADRP